MRRGRDRRCPCHALSLCDGVAFVGEHRTAELAEMWFAGASTDDVMAVTGATCEQVSLACEYEALRCHTAG